MKELASKSACAPEQAAPGAAFVPAPTFPAGAAAAAPAFAPSEKQDRTRRPGEDSLAAPLPLDHRRVSGGPGALRSKHSRPDGLADGTNRCPQCRHLGTAHSRWARADSPRVSPGGGLPASRAPSPWVWATRHRAGFRGAGWCLAVNAPARARAPGAQVTSQEACLSYTALSSEVLVTVTDAPCTWPT